MQKLTKRNLGTNGLKIWQTWSGLLQNVSNFCSRELAPR